MSILLWIVSAVIAIFITGLFTQGGLDSVIYAIKAFRVTSGPYVATAIITLVVRAVLSIIHGVLSSRTRIDRNTTTTNVEYSPDTADSHSGDTGSITQVRTDTTNTEEE